MSKVREKMISKTLKNLVKELNEKAKKMTYPPQETLELFRKEIRKEIEKSPDLSDWLSHSGKAISENIKKTLKLKKITETIYWTGRFYDVADEEVEKKFGKKTLFSDEKRLKEKGWVKVECPDKTEKCGKYYCPPRKREEFKHFTKKEFREARNMTNCPFINYTI